MSFLQKFRKRDFEKRRAEYERMCLSYPEHIPVIADLLEATSGQSDLHLAKHKYIVPADVTGMGFKACLRKHLANKDGQKGALAPDEALFFFVGKDQAMFQSSDTLSQIQKRYADEDGFLYVTASRESTLGA